MQRLVSLALTIAVLGSLWYALWSGGAFLPRWTVWEHGELACGRASGEVGAEIVLRDRKVRVTDAWGNEVYRTPSGWKVSSVAAADLDGDGGDELLMLLWKRGVLGTSHAVWETDPWQRWHPWYAQHLYVLTWRDEKLAPLWMGGDLDAPVSRMYVDAACRVHLVTADGDDTSWLWSHWGFEAAAD